MENTALNLHQSALYSHKERDINHWTDLWFAEDKRAGFVVIANEKYFAETVVGGHDYKRLHTIKQSENARFISLNAFEVSDFKNIQGVRATANLKQIRNIGVDIDQYDLGLTIPEAEDLIYELIRDEIIPVPNLVLKSRGIQLIYSIKGGLSPYRHALAKYITSQFIEKTKHIGSDTQATDMARLFRLPESLNTRNGLRVHPEIWYPYSYDIWELRKYVDKYEPKALDIPHVKTNRIIALNDEAKAMLLTNRARLHDFKKLIKLRNGDFTNQRNILLYNYSFHLSLIEHDLENVLAATKRLFSTVTTRDKSSEKILDETEINITVNSAFDDATKFIKYYQKNGYKIEYKAGDGIIKPKRTETLIKELGITSEEQKHMRTLATTAILRDNRNEKRKKDITEERRTKGVRPRNEYNDERKKKQQSNLKKLQELIKKHPDYTQQQYAELMNVNKSTISRWKKLLN